MKVGEYVEERMKEERAGGSMKTEVSEADTRASVTRGVDSVLVIVDSLILLS